MSITGTATSEMVNTVSQHAEAVQIHVCDGISVAPSITQSSYGVVTRVMSKPTRVMVGEVVTTTVNVSNILPRHNR